MPVKLKLRSKAKQGSFAAGALRFILLIVLVCVVLGTAVFAYYYNKYQHIVDDRIAAGPLFASVAQIYAAPQEVRVGQHLSVDTIATDLRSANYNANPEMGTFQQRPTAILIKPGPQSFHNTDGATITTVGGDVVSITAENGVALNSYELEPQLITALSEDKNRTKRRIVSFPEIPTRLVQAITAIEDRSFFEHGGINYLRIARCAEEDFFSHSKECGGSTLTMQLARGFFLSPEKKYSRKLREIMITFQLENRFNKQQIFAMYANQINLGQRGSFAINGVGEAARAFFGKNLSQLDTAECALLAGTIQSPNRLNPYRHPARAMERRNVVLEAMVETGAITPAEATKAKAEPLRLAPPNVDASEAPYFVDMVHEQLIARLGDNLSRQSLRIYTSLDPQLQREASAAIQEGMKKVDEIVRRRYFVLHHKKGEKFNKDAVNNQITYPQVALIALNPHTGQILALIGGRNYGVSQLNHALSERPTGSIFKPFVYAAAYGTSLNGTQIDANGVFSALTRLNDDSTTFMFNGQPYTPHNFVNGEYPGMQPAANALDHSLNIATIALAQMIGLENVASLARSAGIVNARATPSVAIGTYNATPVDMAGAYTVFANNGVHLKPWMLASVRNPNGDIVADFTPEAKQVMDPRAAYLTQSLLEGVLNYGTAAGVRSQFTAPAAGKTGTEHDAWFAGYSSNLLCVVWVGNDDYTDLKIQGADAAAPIWAAFMKRAIQLPQYSDMKPFTPPTGIQTVKIDRVTWLPADATCPNDYRFAFLDGTVPANTCSTMSDSGQSVVERMLNGNLPPASAYPQDLPPAQQSLPPATTQPEKKRNIFKRLFGFGNDKPAPPQPTQSTPQPPQ